MVIDTDNFVLHIFRCCDFAGSFFVRPSAPLPDKIILVSFSPPSLKNIHYCNGIDGIRKRDGIKIGIKPNEIT
jgi:hypothetical protein